jgi:hypothetical protein
MNGRECHRKGRASIQALLFNDTTLEPVAQVSVELPILRLLREGRCCATRRDDLGLCTRAG